MSIQPKPPLTINHFDVDDFLANYWQKKPLVIRGGISGTEELISPEELAGLACEEEVESRLVTHFDNQWDLTHGPIDEGVFKTLPDSNWTLLVQAVDHWVRDVAKLMDYFHFLPRWRIDDVMVSFAVKEGTVSQHFDYYDVFLVQGIGSRRWQIGEFCNADTELVPDMPMKILKEFRATQEWVLEPGDVLYLPPMLSHYGVALEDCVTYSVGFRAPSYAEIVDGVATLVIEGLREDQRYRDTVEILKGESESSLAMVREVRRILIDQLRSNDVIKYWVEEFVMLKRN